MGGRERARAGKINYSTYRDDGARSRADTCIAIAQTIKRKALSGIVHDSILPRELLLLRVCIAMG